MRKVNRLAAVAVALILLAAVAAPALAGESDVAGFIQQLARSKNLNATDPAIALDSLRAVGVRLPADMQLSKKLTESDVATISRAAGLLVTTSNPDAYFDEDKVDRFFAAFSVELGRSDGSDAFTTTECDSSVENCDNPGQGSGPGTGNGNGPGFDPFSKGRGQKKGKAKQGRTPTDPE
jgi:hypothetical protein